MRSLLFVPGDSPKKMYKALKSGADAIIIDLEDSVAIENKEIARVETLAFLNDIITNSNIPSIYVRINELQTDFTVKDLHVAIAGKANGIMLPKSTSAADVNKLATMIINREEKYQHKDYEADIIAITTETPGSIFNLGSYVEATPRLRALTWGAEDLGAAIGSKSNRDNSGEYTDVFKLVRNLCLLAAAAAQKEAIDGVYVNFRDISGLQKECLEAVRDGFTGKMAIHPDQVAVINDAFTPLNDEIVQAKKIVDAFSNSNNAGVISIDGVMFDKPHLAKAKKILLRAAKYKS